MKRVYLARKRIRILLVYCGVGIILIVFIFPIAWQYLAAFKSAKDMISLPPKIIFEPTLTNWEELLYVKGGLLNLKNSLIVTSISTIVTVLAASLAGYALTRFEFKGRTILGVLILAFYMFPPVTILIPFFVLMRSLRLSNTYTGLILAYVAFNLPFAIWLMRTFFSEIPVDIEEAALVEGCSWFGVFSKIALPISTPGIVATSFLCVWMSWNDYMFASILTGADTQTLALLAAASQTRFGISWGSLAAVTVLLTLPIVALSLIMQKHLIRGLTFGAVKG